MEWTSSMTFGAVVVLVLLPFAIRDFWKRWKTGKWPRQDEGE